MQQKEHNLSWRSWNFCQQMEYKFLHDMACLYPSNNIIIQID